MTRRAYEDTKVAVAKSRDGIEQVLRKWGANGVQWTDDFDGRESTLRFSWSPPGGGEVMAKLVLRQAEVSRTNSQYHQRSDAMMTKLREQERRRIHRVAFHWLKVQHEAVEVGLFGPEQVMLAHLEDAAGKTLHEALAPALPQLSTFDTSARLMLTPGGGQ